MKRWEIMNLQAKANIAHRVCVTMFGAKTSADELMDIATSAIRELEKRTRPKKRVVGAVKKRKPRGGVK